jgi:hypothetical protein
VDERKPQSVGGPSGEEAAAGGGVKVTAPVKKGKKDAGAVKMNAAATEALGEGEAQGAGEVKMNAVPKAKKSRGKGAGDVKMSTVLKEAEVVTGGVAAVEEAMAKLKKNKGKGDAKVNASRQQGGLEAVQVSAVVKEGDEAKGAGRGLHSSTFRLNVSAFCGIGGAIGGYQGVVEAVLGALMGCSGCILCICVRNGSG